MLCVCKLKLEYSAIKYQNILIENVKGLKEIYGAGFKIQAKAQLNLIEDISSHIEAINTMVTTMINKRKKANLIEEVDEKR